MAGSSEARVELTWRTNRRRWRLSGHNLEPPQIVPSAAPTSASIGAGLLDMIVSQHSWLRRRVERVELRDDRVLRRHTSLDFELDDFSSIFGLVRNRDGRLLVPLAILTKQPLSLFDLRTDNGGSVSMLSTDENAELVAAGLVAWLKSIVGVEPPTSVRESITDLVARQHADPFARWREVDRRVCSWAGGRADPDALDSWSGQLNNFADGFMAIAMLDSGHPSSGILKYSYDERFDFDRFGSLDRLGWRPAPLEVELAGLSGSASYHFESEPPPGLIWQSAQMVVVHEDESETVLEPEGRQPHVHLHHGGPPVGAHGIAVLKALPRPRGYLTVASLNALFSALVMWVGWSRIDQLTDSAGSGAASQLLTLAGLGTSFLLRSSEHRLLSRLLRGPRVLAWTVPLWLFVLAGSLILGLHPGIVVDVWRSGAIWSTGVAVVVALAGRESHALR